MTVSSSARLPAPDGNTGPDTHEAGFSRSHRAIAWLALLVGFSPSLAALGRELSQVAPERICLFAVGLFGLGLLREARSRPPQRTLGLWLIALGVGVQLFGFAGQVHGLALLGLPTAVCGMALWQGKPSLGLACLAFWWIPLPLAIVLLGTPELESAYAAGAAGIVQLFSNEVVQPAGPLFQSSVGRFELTYFDSGYPLASALSALAWYDGLRRGSSFVFLGVRAAAGVAAGFLLQFPLITLAVACFAAGAPTLATALPLLGPWAIALTALSLQIYLTRSLSSAGPASD